MSYPATLTDTELSAVNQILGAVGQAPSTTLDDTNPEIAIIYDTLVAVNREIQSEGWAFNREREYTFTPDVNKEILLPDNIVQIVLSDLPENRDIDVVPRDKKLYNKTDHTFLWDHEVKCDITWLFDFTDTPSPFRDYVVARSAVIAATRIIGDKTQFSLLKDREQSARAMVLQYECEQGQYSMFGFPNGRNFYSSYQPYKTLSR
jgi:hypothetical protein